MALLDVAGRQVHYECSVEDPSGPTALVFHHGQPGAAFLDPRWVGAAAGQEWPLVMLSRPGYGLSHRRAGRSVSDVAGDVAAVLDHLGVEHFVTAGWSGGGPHALAGAALLPDRCLAAATIAGVAPYAGVGDLEWTEGMGAENVEEFEAVIAGDPHAEGRIRDLCLQLADIRAEQLIDALGGLLSAPDKQILSGEFGEYVAAWCRLAAANGYHGYWDDGQAFVCPWGFDLAAITVPVRVWWTDLDLMVPPSHGEWLATHVAGARPAYVGGEGHLSLLARYAEEIVAGLAADAGGK
jgi:pimeloyl-ACP methyl ester carboxylesterase